MKSQCSVSENTNKIVRLYNAICIHTFIH
uniref:Uncharacterized protein n=1 Tax=Anguilla anguilla TaxID=7936 RepID=A0A0E9RDB5_ANGAN